MDWYFYLLVFLMIYFIPYVVYRYIKFKKNRKLKDLYDHKSFDLSEMDKKYLKNEKTKFIDEWQRTQFALDLEAKQHGQRLESSKLFRVYYIIAVVLVFILIVLGVIEILIL